MRDYSLVILDRAFLCHSPGIKRRKKKKLPEDSWRDPFIANNSRVYDKIMEELDKKFGSNEKCKKYS